MIVVRNLTKYFGRRKAVDQLSFEVQEGEIVGLLGPNGAGKTTTMRILTGYLTATEGTVQIDGRDISTDSRAIRRVLGYLPEDVSLYRDMTVEGFLRFVALLKGLPRPERHGAVEQVTELCRIGDSRKRLIGKLSKGYRQRVGLAQALIGTPKVLVLDEPTSGLDPKQINEIRELIRSFRGRQTILLSTHILPEVQAVSDRVLIINEGKLVAQGTSEELSERFQTAQEILVTVRGDMSLVKATLDRVPGILNVERVKTGNGDAETYRIYCDKTRDNRGPVARVLADAGLELLELKSDVMSLEDIFLKLVTQEEAESPAVSPAAAQLELS